MIKVNFNAITAHQYSAFEPGFSIYWDYLKISLLGLVCREKTGREMRVGQKFGLGFRIYIRTLLQSKIKFK